MARGWRCWGGFLRAFQDGHCDQPGDSPTTPARRVRRAIRLLWHPVFRKAHLWVVTSDCLGKRIQAIFNGTEAIFKRIQAIIERCNP